MGDLDSLGSSPGNWYFPAEFLHTSGSRILRLGCVASRINADEMSMITRPSPSNGCPVIIGSGTESRRTEMIGLLSLLNCLTAYYNRRDAYSGEANQHWVLLSAFQVFWTRTVLRNSSPEFFLRSTRGSDVRRVARSRGDF